MGFPLASTNEFGHRMGSWSLAYRRKLQGLLLFRLLLGVFFLLLSILVQSQRRDDLVASQLYPLYFFSAVLFIFTIVASLSLERVQHLKRFAGMQILFDVVAVTILIFLSGGVHSLFSFLYMPVIISAAVLLPGKGSFWTASICSLGYGIMLDLQFFDWIRPMQVISTGNNISHGSVYFHTLLMNIAAFFLVAYLSNYLSQELQRSSDRIYEQQQDLQQLEMFNRNIVQCIKSGLLTTDLQGLIQYSNLRAQEILGLPEDQILQRPAHAFFPELRQELALAAPSGSASTTLNHTERTEIFYRQPSGAELYLGYTISLLEDQPGRPYGWIVNFQDLTAFRKMRTHMQRMEQLALAGKMAAEIAHEIKNPLAAMSGSMQMLQNELSHDPQCEKLTGIVSREIDRINSLVTDFLWLTKSPSKPKNLQPLCICQSLLDSLRLLQQNQEMSPAVRLTTLFEVEPCIPLDEHHFQQVVWNLLKNAVEAMPEGGELAIHVRKTRFYNDSKPALREEISIDIKDTGCGIPPETQEKIFEPFFTTKRKGTGLGLSMVYQLVQNMGGRIEVHSELNRGSTFSVILPTA